MLIIRRLYKINYQRVYDLKFEGSDCNLHNILNWIRILIDIQSDMHNNYHDNQIAIMENSFNENSNSSGKLLIQYIIRISDKFIFF